MDEKEFKKDIGEMLVIMQEIETLKEDLAEAKKEAKEKHGLALPKINKILTLISKQTLAEEEQKLAEIARLVRTCD